MKNYADMFKVLSDVNRVKILDLLVKGETCSCELIHDLPISQPTLSYHLKLLSEVGLIQSVKDGNRINYTVNKEKLLSISKFIQDLTVCNDFTCAT